MSLGFFSIIPFSLLCLIAVVRAQSSTTTLTSITGSVTGTAISEPTSLASSSSVSGSRTSSSSGSGSLSASSTLSAELPSLSGYSTCVTNCLQLSIADANCTSVAQINCYCGSTNFTSSLTDCVTGECPDELSMSETLAQRFCVLASTSTSLSFSVTSVSSSSTTSSSSSTITGTGSTTATGPSSTSTRTVSSTVSEPASSSASSNAALGRKVVGISGSVVWSIFAVVLGVLVGGMTVC
ncbi:uncharacterized protein EV420DRAFT_1648364 [Desarmillaria tabescens]|uniref:CFEM domain-containing protein n=1 Tax=Armillaria tabescens TaxID=1929756 RepID=A0AA39JN79_ARMTA|nr:uncharacterized protein EV420DRAFT_1648364 [Desarmillaria tabescens]KAK0445649.1 hypothetical protein EV420DRAFT_1648364 [Desarmillaria tabescens]